MGEKFLWFGSLAIWIIIFIIIATNNENDGDNNGTDGYSGA